MRGDEVADDFDQGQLLRSLAGAGSDGHQCELADHESDQPWKRLLHETVGMQAHAKHVYAEPRETGDDVAEERHDHQAALPNESAPARVPGDCAPKNDQRAISFGSQPQKRASGRQRVGGMPVIRRTSSSPGSIASIEAYLIALM